MGIQFIWQENYTVGNEELDSQHRYLFELGNRIQTAQPSEARTFVMSLYKYTRVHFAREEQHMQALGFPDSEAHRLEHERLLSHLNELAQGFQPDRMNDLVVFFNNWLVNHVLNDDRRYFDFARSLVR